MNAISVDFSTKRSTTASPVTRIKTKGRFRNLDLELKRTFVVPKNGSRMPNVVGQAGLPLGSSIAGIQLRTNQHGATRATIILRPTVSLDARPIVVPILIAIIGFPVFALAVICLLRYRSKRARYRDHVKRMNGTNLNSSTGGMGGSGGGIHGDLPSMYQGVSMADHTAIAECRAMLELDIQPCYHLDYGGLSPDKDTGKKSRRGSTYYLEQSTSPQNGMVVQKTLLQVPQMVFPGGGSIRKQLTPRPSLTAEDLNIEQLNEIVEILKT